MASGDWRVRLLASTRGRIVQLLRRSARTVNDLAGRLDLTDNAIRLHLSALERDGLVEQHAVRRESVGKPAYIYRTTGAAEALFPKPYDRVLAELLSVLETRMGPAELEVVLREVGRRLGATARAEAADMRERAGHAASVLTALGGLAEVEGDERGVRIQGFSCPLGAVTTAHPETCSLAEAMVSEMIGARVVVCCERGDRPRCAFRVLAAEA